MMSCFVRLAPRVSTEPPGVKFSAFAGTVPVRIPKYHYRVYVTFRARVPSGCLYHPASS